LNQLKESTTATLDHLYNELSKAVVGRRREIKLLFAALLSRGHVLLEDMPGMGKTTLVKAFSKVLDCQFTRVQCTPDLLPSDVIGVSIFNPKTSEFTFRKGPVFTQLLLVDEINRALPRTQSSLLESMEERQVSVEGTTYPLPEPFMVLATQNPVEMEGTFPLPEAQLDRFLIRLQLGYPTPAEEEEILERVGGELPYDQLAALLNPSRLADYQKQSDQVFVHASVRQYIVALANETRSHPLIAVGASPRASKALFQIAKTWAFLEGREYVLPDDVKALVRAVWGHRLMLKPEARMTDWTPEAVLDELVNKVKLPEEAVVRSNE
jgi:MoxR-like ATPase